MTVRSIRRRLNPKTGNVAITFEVSPETWRAMVEASKAGSFPDGLDYVAGTLNMAFLDIEPVPPPSTPVAPPPRSSDMDDDIPF